MKLVIVRHGDTEWTVSRRYTGSTDLPLTRHGCAQAAALAPLLERLLSAQTVLVFASPLQRATTTAALALPGWPVTPDELVTEYDYGDYEGLTGEQIQQLAPGWDIWRDGCHHGDSTSAVGQRVDGFLAAHALGTARRSSS
jgi:broad specificity phosphatase PhoE